MPKRRKKMVIELSPEQVEQLEDLKRRMKETDRRIEEALKMADEAQRRLRAAYQRR
jgi:hypothetical protein